MSPTPPAEAPWERLEAWRASHELALVVYRATRRWPVHARVTLAPEMHAAVVRAGASLMHVAVTQNPRERAPALQDAHGAIARLSCLLLIARDLGVIDRDEWQLLDGFAERAGQLTGGLRRALRTRAPARPQLRPG
jgi:four helix bundle protein